MANLMLRELWLREVLPNVQDPWDVRALSLVSRNMQEMLRPHITTTPGEDRTAFGTPDKWEKWTRMYDHVEWNLALLASVIRHRNTALVGRVPRKCLSGHIFFLLATRRDLVSEEERASVIKMSKETHFFFGHPVALPFWPALLIRTDELHLLCAVWTKTTPLDHALDHCMCVVSGPCLDLFPKTQHLWPQEFLDAVLPIMWHYMIRAPSNVSEESLDWAWARLPRDDQQTYTLECGLVGSRCRAIAQLQWLETRFGYKPSILDLDTAIKTNSISLARWLVARGVPLQPHYWGYMEIKELSMYAFLKEANCPWDGRIFLLHRSADTPNDVIALLADMLCPPDKRAIADTLLKNPEANIDKLRRLLEIAEARYKLAWDHDMGLM